jgi:hypothetical protein
MFYSWKHNRIQLYSRIGFRGEGTNIVKDDKPIRLNRNLIHRMISSKTIQKPASTGCEEPLCGLAPLSLDM